MSSKFWTELNDQQAENVCGGTGFTGTFETDVYNKKTGEVLTTVTNAGVDTPRNQNSFSFQEGGKQPFSLIPE